MTFPLGRSSRSAGGGGVGHAHKDDRDPPGSLLEGNGRRGLASQSADGSRHITVPFPQGLKEPDRLVEAEAMTIEDYRGFLWSARPPV
jgi:hypothetical protein